MRRRSAALLLGLLLLVPACSPAEKDPTMTPPPLDLDAEQVRLTAAVTALDGVREAQVRLRSDATVGRQVTVTAVSGHRGPDELHDVLDAVTHAAWDTAVFVPTEVRTSVVGDGGRTVDVRDLGFTRRGASSSWLFDRYGPPAADGTWRP